MDESQQELLLALMSMGFEYDNCMKVINDGVHVLDDAVQRLMNPDQEESYSQSSSSTTTPVVPATPHPFNPSDVSQAVEESVTRVTSRYERQRKEQEEYERQEFKAAEIQRKKQKTEDRKLKQNLLREIASDRQQHKHGSGEPTSNQNDGERRRKEKEEYERKQKELHAEKWKQMEKNKRLEKQRVLAAIEEDKKNKRKQREQSSREKVEIVTRIDPLQQTQSHSSEKKMTCRIQVNFPSGSQKVYTLPSESNLQELYNLCQEELKEEESVLDLAFLQTFPRRKITTHEFSKSFQDLGMCPSCRLIMQKDTGTSAVLTSEPSFSIPSNTASIPRIPSASSAEASSTTSEPVCETSFPRESSQAENHDLNRAHSPALKRPCIESRLLHGGIDNQINDFEHEIDDDESNHDDDDVANPSVIEEAIRRRLNNKTDQSEGPFISRKMTSLQKLVAVYVATQLIKKEPNIVEHIGLLNPTAADFIVRALLRSSNLSVDLLNILQPCRLKEINLNLWRLAPLDLVYALKSHQNLRKISLQYVTCVSDRLVETLVKNIPRISYLNLSDCDGIIGSFITSSRGLSRLKTLILNRTKVKDDYIRNFLRLETAKDLNELGLSKCPITSLAFDLEKNFPSIQAISINETGINDLSFLQYFPNVTSLNLRMTRINNKDMTFVGSLTNLKALDLQSTQITYDGLLHIQDKQLVRFNLPDRLIVSNECIKVIEGFQLTSLDLSMFVRLDDGCLPSICKIKSLKSLDLAQIPKLTDAGILQLKDLRELETLNLRKANLTSSIGPLLKSLPSLHTLNVAATKIDNEFIPSLSGCQNLVKLNMSYTNVDNDGIVCLQLPRLNILTLEGTEVTSDVIRWIVSKCPMLTCILNASKNVLYKC